MSENQKQIKNILIMLVCIVMIPLAWNALTSTKQEITPASASEVRLSTAEQVVINQQEAKLLDLNLQIEKITTEVETTKNTIQMLKKIECKYTDLKTCVIAKVEKEKVEIIVEKVDPKVKGLK